MVMEKSGGAHGRGVGNFLRAGTCGLRVAARANCPVCSVSYSPPAVTEIHLPFTSEVSVSGTPHSWHL
jgi:hypothetical protein